MLTNIQIVAGTTTIDLPVVGAQPTDPFTLKFASGLGPPKIDLTIDDYSGDGGLYRSKHSQKREIVLRIGINPDYTDPDPVGVRRDLLYHLLSPSATADYVVFHFIDSVRDPLLVSAYVETFEMPVSSKEAEVQITFICPNSYLHAEDSVTTDYSVGNTLTIDYPGSAKTGFHGAIQLTADASWVQLTNGAKFMRFEGSWLSGDVIKFSTHLGFKSIERIRSAVYTDALQTLTSTSSWLFLHRGINQLVVTASAGAPYITPTTYTPEYWGI